MTCDGLADEVSAVAACVRDGTAPPCTAMDGKWSTLLCLAAERSVETKAEVNIADFVRQESC